MGIIFQAYTHSNYIIITTKYSITTFWTRQRIRKSSLYLLHFFNQTKQQEKKLLIILLCKSEGRNCQYFYMNTTSIWIGLRRIKKLQLQYQGHLLIKTCFCYGGGGTGNSLLM